MMSEWDARGLHGPKARALVYAAYPPDIDRRTLLQEPPETQSRRWTTRLAVALALPLLAAVAAGCHSVSPMQQRAAGYPAAEARFGPALATSISAIAESRGHPNRRARNEARHRQLLAGHLDQLLEEATPLRPTAGVKTGDGLLDPDRFNRITAVKRVRANPSSLERAGIGLPVVVNYRPARDPNAPRAGYHLAATLVVRPVPAPSAEKPSTTSDDPRPTPERRVARETAQQRAACCEAALVDPDAVDQVPTAAGPLPVAMDLAAPIAATRATGVGPLDGIANLVRPGRFMDEPRIVFLEPFDADKMPVVFVHGLLSTPGVWKPLVTQLLADPRIRGCCQFWFFYYPTGQPVPLSALQLRGALDEAVRNTGLTRKMMLIGHSMGGILSRAQVSRLTPERAERLLPGVSSLSDYSRVRRSLIFEPRTDVSRVVFLFVPHRGSRFAANGFGATAVRLIRLPDTLINEGSYALDRLAGLESRRLPTSIHGLSPRSPFLRALNATTPTVPVHSIIGNRGRGDGSRGSDGVVPVRSARVESAESELVVPTGHGGFTHPDAVAEIRRIILLEAEKQQTISHASAGKDTKQD